MSELNLLLEIRNYYLDRIASEVEEELNGKSLELILALATTIF